MKASELRIGNFVVETVFGRIGIVLHFSRVKISIKLEKSTMRTPCCNVVPVKLTEEWMKRFGFIEYEDKEFYSSEEPLFGIKLNHSIEGCKIKVNMHIWDSSYTGAQCEYIHQLQNLYFSLTSKELAVRQISARKAENK